MINCGAALSWGALLLLPRLGLMAGGKLIMIGGTLLGVAGEGTVAVGSTVCVGVRSSGSATPAPITNKDSSANSTISSPRASTGKTPFPAPPAGVIGRSSHFGMVQYFLRQ